MTERAGHPAGVDDLHSESAIATDMDWHNHVARPV